ncbi:MAG: hypothetical protein WA945_06470 [Arcobacteraceae bacterium]
MSEIQNIELIYINIKKKYKLYCKAVIGKKQIRPRELFNILLPELNTLLKWGLTIQSIRDKIEVLTKYSFSYSSLWNFFKDLENNKIPLYSSESIEKNEYPASSHSIGSEVQEDIPLETQEPKKKKVTMEEMLLSMNEKNN